MKQLIKQKVSHVEFIRQKMITHGWNAAQLSRVSGVSTGVLSRYFNDDGISADNLFAVMEALNLFEKKGDKNCNVACDQEMTELCRKVKEVVESKTHWGSSLEANINSFKSGYDNDKRVDELETAVRELKKSNADLSLEYLKKDTGKKKAM